MKDYIGNIIDLTSDGYLNPPWPSNIRPLKDIKTIAVHHDATVRPHDYDSVARYKQEAAEHYLRLGPGLMYHYKIDNIGQIFKIRPHELWLYSVGSVENYSTINICLDGYFHPDINQHPTREQYESLVQLLDNLATKHPEFPAGASDVYPHRHYSATACCGDILVPFVEQYRNSAGVNDTPPADANYDWPTLQPNYQPPAPAPVVPPTPTPPSPPDPTPTSIPVPTPKPDAGHTELLPLPLPAPQPNPPKEVNILLADIISFLQGKKTFFVAGALLLSAFLKLLATGDFSLDAIGSFLTSEQVDLAILASTLRLALQGK